MVNSNNLLTNLKNSSIINLLLCLAASLSISQPAYAQISEFKILPSDGDSLDWFGGSVSISGDYAIVGATVDDNNNGINSGSAYLYSGFAAAVGVESEIAGLPAEFELSQNYPNPFNPETVIEFALPQSGDVSLVVYNIRGEEVARLLSGTVPAGNHRVIWDASSLASGIYIYRLRAGDYIETRKMVLLK